MAGRRSERSPSFRFLCSFFPQTICSLLPSPLRRSQRRWRAVRSPRRCPRRHVCQVSRVFCSVPPIRPCHSPPASLASCSPRLFVCRHPSSPQGPCNRPRVCHVRARPPASRLPAQIRSHPARPGELPRPRSSFCFFCLPSGILGLASENCGLLPSAFSVSQRARGGGGGGGS